MSAPFVEEIRISAGTFAPRGWDFCYDQVLAVATNSKYSKVFLKF
jgi:microcystin-dependent protein